VERKLTTILAADVVGYSRLMENDEAGTFDRLRAHRKELFEPEIVKHHGRIFKLMGDGLLAEFGSVVDAVECAVALQRGLAERNANVPNEQRIDVRIGINLGEVIVEGDDRLGEGVNIAARLQQIADPGGICVSAKVSKEVEKKLGFAFEPMGHQKVKNIAEPINVFKVQLEGLPSTASPAGKTLPLPDKPSIAVLAFDNLSGDPDQEYFADGIVEEIITALSRMRWLFVIARNSSFTYKGRAVDVKQIRRELGVHYILEGSVRKAGNRVRITAQLVDTSSSAHLWADRFDGSLDDIFDLQDQVTSKVVGAIAPKLEQAEIERAKRKPTQNLDAYDYYLRGLAAVHKWTKEANDEALANLNRAIELDPDFASAYGMAARCYSQRKASGWVKDPADELAEAERLARRAAELGKDDAVALCTAGIALDFVVGDVAGAAALIERAIGLNPNLAWAWLFSAWSKISLGEPDAAIERVSRAMRLSPNDPQSSSMQSVMANAHFNAGRYAEALAWAEIVVRDNANYLLPACVAAASAALAGRPADAELALARVRRIDPALRVSNLKKFLDPIRRPEELARWVDGMRLAGLPE
jgi:TolB-like protein/class 3 adenylate cyclase/Tfp pilus assembly protein PilF